MKVKQLLDEALRTASSDAEVRIEVGGEVGKLEVKSIYAVPASEDGEYPAALHIEVGYPVRATRAGAGA